MTAIDLLTTCGTQLPTRPNRLQISKREPN